MSDKLDRRTLDVVRQFLSDLRPSDAAEAFDRRFPPPVPDLPSCIWCGLPTELDNAEGGWRRLCCPKCEGRELGDGRTYALDTEGAIEAYLLPLKSAEHRGRMRGLKEAQAVCNDPSHTLKEISNLIVAAEKEAP